MKDIVIGPHSYSDVGLDVFDFNGFVDVDDVLSLVAELGTSWNTLTRTRFFPMTLTTSPT